MPPVGLDVQYYEYLGSKQLFSILLPLLQTPEPHDTLAKAAVGDKPLFNKVQQGGGEFTIHLHCGTRKRRNTHLASTLLQDQIGSLDENLAFKCWECHSAKTKTVGVLVRTNYVMLVPTA